MDAATIIEINKTRVAQGMKPLPVPGESGPQFKDNVASDEDEEEEPASTLETREAASYENYKKVKDAEEAKRRRDEKTAAIKKAREAAQRFERLEGKGLGEAEDEGDLDAKSWLVAQKKRQKRIDKARKMEEELAAAEEAAAAAVQYTSKDLAGVKVAHEVSAFEDGDEQILTLKDSNVIGDDDDEGDELENLDLREREQLKERLDLKKKKPVYDPLTIDETGEQSLLAQYDEEIGGKKVKRFTLNAQGTSKPIEDAGAMPQNRKLQKIDLDIFKDDQPSSDYLDISEVKVRKPKKKKSKSTRQRPVDEDDIFPIDTAPQDQSMDIDLGAGFVSKKRKIQDTTYADDEDLQATLAIQRRDALKKRKRTRPEDIARQLREEAQTPDAEGNEAQAGGLVIDEISEFVAGLKKEEVDARKPRDSKTPNPEAVTAMDDESDEDEPMKDRDVIEEARQRETLTPDITSGGVDEEAAIGLGVGLGNTVNLLRERKLLKDSGASELNEKLRDQQNFQAEIRRVSEGINQKARAQRERERASGKLDKMSVRERDEYQRQANDMRDHQNAKQLLEVYKDYKPNVELKYVDEHGRSLDQKEAFKHLSHQFHGKGSGKGKTDKLLKKMETEKRREAQSILDVSQNVGMSSATAQQTKKRGSAGVRLA